MARRIYATRVPEEIDVGIFNAFPVDTEFCQPGKAFNIRGDPGYDLVKKGGTIVLSTASSEGPGFHYLMDVGMRLSYTLKKRVNLFKKLSERQFIVFSPNVSTAEVWEGYGDGTLLFNEWPKLLNYLSAKHGVGTHAVVFPCASLQCLRRTRRPNQRTPTVGAFKDLAGNPENRFFCNPQSGGSSLPVHADAQNVETQWTEYN